MEFGIVLVCLICNFIALGNSDLSVFQLYNRENEICCEGVVRRSDNLPLKCCGKEAYNDDTQICCNGLVADNLGQNLTCCNNQIAIIQNNELCCDNDLIRLPGLVEEFECCGKLAYAFDSTTLCCNGSVHKHSDSPHSVFKCCGQLIYDENVQTCCGGNVFDKAPSACPSSIDYSCCDNRVVGPHQQCCNGAVVNLNVNKDHEYLKNRKSLCCGQLVIQNPESELCCNGSVMFGDKRHSCCGPHLYHMDTQFCCRDKIYSGTGECCGSVPFDSEKHVCCKGIVLQLVDNKDACWYPGKMDEDENEDANVDV